MTYGGKNIYSFPTQKQLGVHSNCMSSLVGNMKFIEVSFYLYLK